MHRCCVKKNNFRPTVHRIPLQQTHADVTSISFSFLLSFVGVAAGTSFYRSNISMFTVDSVSLS